MFRAPYAQIEPKYLNSSSSSAQNENKFHDSRLIYGISVDLSELFTQYEKINYIVCDGRSAL